MHLQINLLAEHLDPLHCLAQWHRVLNAEGHSSHAAESMFIGRVRATNAEGQPLAALELEHYPGMTERQLQELAHACCQRHGVSRCLIQHRIGRVLPGDAIVLVVIGADRRGPAQRCCQDVLEALKHDAPFWKREWRRDGGSSWLSGNTPL
jgi:molybdopterin synthase catalytic subunit